MQLSTIVKPDAVRTYPQVSSKKRLFQDIADLAHQVYGLDAARTLDALQERESLGPTGVGNGVALPHARLHGLDGVAGIFVKLDKPLDFDAVDRQPVDLVFALFSPVHDGASHLKALAEVSRMFRDEASCAQLRGAKDAGALFALLSPIEERDAA